MLIGDLLEPLAYVPGIELVLALVLLLLECGRLVQDNLALRGSAVHAYCVCGLGGHLLDLLDHLGELGRADAVLDHHVVDSLAVEVLLGLLGVDGVGPWLVVKEDLAAAVARGLQRQLDQLCESYVHDWELEGYVSEVARAILVLVAAGVAPDAGVYDSHLGVHQSLLVRVPVILVCISGLDLNG